jgi:hypothetical protein
VTVQRKTHLKQTQSQLRQQSNFDLEHSDLIIDDEITYGRNRRSAEFGRLVEDDELSDYVKLRLWLARQMAIKAYHNNMQ